MEARHIVYVLSSSERPDLFRYIGHTSTPRTRLANHARQSTLVGCWMYWERIGGNAIEMREVASFATQHESEEAEQLWITSLTGCHLFNRESWSVAQHNAGASSKMQYIYHEMLHHATRKLQRGLHKDASEWMYLSKVLSHEFYGLSISSYGQAQDKGLRICARLGAATAFPVIETADPLSSRYRGHMHDCLRWSVKQ